jgi:hypothetical protein
MYGVSKLLPALLSLWTMMTIMMITKIEKMMIMMMRKRRRMMMVMVTTRWYGMCTDRKHSVVLNVNKQKVRIFRTVTFCGSSTVLVSQGILIVEVS